ncbi:hypothetical protein OU532_08255, partial [Escherichia coli]|nr:hypothetical protein [Escherichia coli]
MLSIFKTGQAADSVPAEKIQVTYRRYRMQALLSVFLGYLAGFAPIFPDTCYHLTHYWPAAADIPV